MTTGTTKLAGVLGWPVSHSKSPALHGHWLARYGIDGAYLPLAVKPEVLEQALRALPVMGFRGVNITVPHKEEACRLCDTVDPQAKKIGAVNTIRVEEDGSLFGWNTDGIGFLRNLASNSGWKGPAGPAVVLGAGGASRAVLAALVETGVPEIRLVNRTVEKAERVAAEIGGPIQSMGFDSVEQAMDGAALLVNTTSLGMSGQPPLDISLDTLPASAVVTDIVYSPLETPLLVMAEGRGNKTVDGLGMLLHQAAPGFAAWFGREPEVDQELRDAVLAG
ncbi:MAG: shikimate dehydrogenase [Alphaproteobacteria bacterium]